MQWPKKKELKWMRNKIYILSIWQRQGPSPTRCGSFLGSFWLFTSIPESTVVHDTTSNGGNIRRNKVSFLWRKISLSPACCGLPLPVCLSSSRSRAVMSLLSLRWSSAWLLGVCGSLSPVQSRSQRQHGLQGCQHGSSAGFAVRWSANKPD